jgi:hypothetical protein
MEKNNLPKQDLFAPCCLQIALMVVPKSQNEKKIPGFLACVASARDQYSPRAFVDISSAKRSDQSQARSAEGAANERSA